MGTVKILEIKINQFNWKNTWDMISSENFSKCDKILNEQIIIHSKLLEQFIKENNIIDLWMDNKQLSILVIRWKLRD